MDLFIDWSIYQRRSDTLAREMHLEMHFLEWKRFRRKVFFPLRYLGQFIQTLLILKKNKPELVVVKGVPTCAPLAVWLYSWFAGTKYIIDAHNITFEGKWGKLFSMLKMIGKGAEVILIHNEPLRDKIGLEAHGMKTFVLEDRIPDPENNEIDISEDFSKDIEHTMVTDDNTNGNIPENDSGGEREKLRITMISNLSFNEDIAMVVETLGDKKNIEITVTGNTHRARGKTRKLIQQPPGNVTFTGYIPDVEYWDLLGNSDILLINDVRNNVLSCGGYETIAVRKPLVIPRNDATEQYYKMGAVLYDRHDSHSLVKAIEEAAAEKSRLMEEMVELRKIRDMEWDNKLSNLMKSIGKG